VDRYDTAKVVAESQGRNFPGQLNGGAAAILASGEDAHFADALAASPMSFAKHFPSLLTTTASLSSSARAALSDLAIKQVVIVGGPAAVSDAVANEVHGMGIAVQRIGGQDRTDTAGKVADFELASLGFTPTSVELVRGDLFPDSLTGGAAAGLGVTPVVLTEDPATLGSFTRAWLASHAQPLTGGHVFGGTAAVTVQAQSDAEAIVRSNSTQSPGATTTTTGPSGPMHFTWASASAGASTATVTYNNDALCSTVDSDASDFAGAVFGPSANGPVELASFAFAGASCSSTAQPTITLTLPQSVTLISGQTLQVKAQVGKDGDTVRDLLLAAQWSGDAIAAKV
jgi:hypothetical protein